MSVEMMMRDSTIQRVGAVASPVGLVLPEDLKVNDWRRIVDEIEHVGDGMMWWRADLAAHGERWFRREYGDLLNALYARQTLYNLATVSRAFEISRRRENLSFGHHEVVSPLEAEDQEIWLNDALRGGWSRNELRERVAAWRRGDPRDRAAVVFTYRPAADLSELFTRAAAKAGLSPVEWLARAGERAARAELGEIEAAA